jgi:hypothetical protein
MNSLVRIFPIFALVVSGVCAAEPPASKPPAAVIPAGAQQAAFGVESIKLGGVFDHRIKTMIKGNLFKLDMEQNYLTYFRNKRETRGLRMLGMTLDAAVRLCAYSRDPELIAWKNRWVDELIATQEPNGYIGIFPVGPLRAGDSQDAHEIGNYDAHEKGQIIMALVNDYRIFGRSKSLEAARRLADDMIATWSSRIIINRGQTGDRLFAGQTGDRLFVQMSR